MVVARNAFNRPITFFVKHLEQLCPDLDRILIIDNSPLAYAHNKGVHTSPLTLV
jgi:TFIIF-interacting CTD phosphatase-like protein